MALSADAATDVVKHLIKVRQAEADRLDRIHDYMRNKRCGIYVPRSATAEYRRLVDQSKINILPLVVTAVAQNLFADGYRPARSMKNAKPWEIWQANRWDARQAGVYRAALTYGVTYASALPGDPVPVLTPYSPRQMTAVYEDPINDEWPIFALCVMVQRDEQGRPVNRMRLFDDTMVYRFTGTADGQNPTFDGADEHGLGVTPVVRWLNEYGDIDDGPQGEVEPLIPLQDSLQQTTFSLRMAEHYAAFRQRWVTGMKITEDENGNPLEPWNAAVNRVWQSESPDTKFGDFAETSLDGYLASRKATLSIISAIAQIPPHALLVSDGISNLSAEALAAIESGLQRKVGERKTSFGESNEQLLRLASLAAGDEAGWLDTSAEIQWRDTESRSLAQVADALGKMAQMLGVPPRALWSELPGMTDEKLQRWEAIADEDGGLAELNQMLRQTVERAPGGIPGRQPANAPA